MEKINPVGKAEREGRLQFFRNGSYKYIPTTSTAKRIEEAKKPFNSARANSIHEVKIMNRKEIWKEADRRLAKIEKYVDKGLIKISNKQFICN